VLNLSDESSDLLFEVRDGIAILTLNRPDRLNAVRPGFHELLFGRAEQIRHDPSIRAVVLTGAGRAFCAGADVGALGGGEYGKADRSGFPIHPEGQWPVGWFGMIVPKPVVCAVNGAAVGYGAELMATCDMRVAAESARIGWTFAKLGIVTDMGVGPVILPRLLGLSQAARLLYSGDVIDAREALRIGLVDEVVPVEEVVDRAIAIAKNLAQGAPGPVAVMKRQLYASMLENPHDLYYDNLDRFEDTMSSDEFKEGVAAFMEKRLPAWAPK
jgi:enoyl-CoA hydratase/carnithine racemase